MEDFAKKLAINHHVEIHSNRKTFPCDKLKEEYRAIRKTYFLLNESVAKDVSIPPSGEWLLDNFYLIEEQYHFCMNDLTIQKYQKLPSVQGEARIFILARELVSFTDGNISEEVIQKFFLSYQSKRSLSMEEIAIFPLMLKIALLHHIYEISLHIQKEQLEKFKAESLMERIVSRKAISKQQFKKYRKINLNGELMTYIEYLICSLKKQGRDDLIDILEEEIIKKGTTSSEIIKTLHFDMAVRRISMSNSIVSLKNMTRYHWTTLFEIMNPVERILKQDEIYRKMSYETKERYLEEVKQIAKKAHVSEVYVGNKLIELSKKEHKHVGFFLFRGERKLLATALEAPTIFHKKVSKKWILTLFIISIYLPSLLISYFLFQKYFWIGFLPISEVFVVIVNFWIRKIKKPTVLMQMEEIDDNVETLVIVPTLLNGKERVCKLMQDMEIYYLANQDAKLRFCLLGDASESNTENTSFDEEVKQMGVLETVRLNEKYHQEIFYFLYRKRVYNPLQEKWLGYERKRGMIEELNHFLMTGETGTFCVNTMRKIPKFKYIITIDADTNLILGSAKKLIGIMEHPFNEPVIQNYRVVSGYGLVQPKICTSIEESHRTLFAKLFAGNGGLDRYSGAEFNLYQDLFDEAIFTGKGIFRVELYERLLYHQIPENRVLSHDLIEGSFLRTGLASNVTLMDGFPSHVNSYFFRLKRWTRGDVQNIWYLFHKHLKGITKYQIWDNLRRSLIPIFLFFLLGKGFYIETLGIVFFPFLWELLCAKKHLLKGKRQKIKTHFMMLSLYRCAIMLIFLPYQAILMIEAIGVSLYRMFISHKHLLDWTTAADSEKMLKNDLYAYFRFMMPSVLPIALFFCLRYPYLKLEWLVCIFFLLIWFMAPYMAYTFSKEKKENTISLKPKEKEEIFELAYRTWLFFKTYLVKEYHFLIPDNYQKSRKRQVSRNTSSTNIGLSMLAVISAYDLSFISRKDMLFYLSEIIQTITNLSKWQGHLYNWYDILTLKPLEPRFVSTVDSGNLIACLYVVKTVLMRENEKELSQKVQEMIDDTHFSALYDSDKNLFSIGYDVSNQNLLDSYYDLLASEARTASLVAIAKKDIPYKHWFCLGRNMTTMGGGMGLLSWSGTMFEYFMPNVIMKPPKNTLLEETNAFCIMSQQRYAQKLNIPWGISESAFHVQDFHLNYQYKAFGIPWLGLKRGLKDEVVVSPYSSLLAISEAPKEVLKNMRTLKELGAYAQFGFYESIDFTPSRVKDTYEVVETYMAHHQALILLSITNFLKEESLIKRFMQNPEIQAVKILLEEKIPESIIDTKEKKEKAKRLQYQDYEEYTEKVIHKEKKNVNLLGGETMTMLMNDYGEGYVETNGILFSPYQEGKTTSSTFFIKDKQTNFYWSNTLSPAKKKPDESMACFSPAFCEFMRSDDGIQILTKYLLSSEDRTLLKEVTLYHHRESEANLDLYQMEEVILCLKDSFLSHPAYQGLFLNAQNYQQDVLMEKKFQNGKVLYYMNFVTDEQGVNANFEIELDKTKVIGRGRSMQNPIMVEQDKTLSNQIVSTVSPMVTLKKSLTLKPEEKVTFYFYSMVGDTKEEIESLYEKYHKFDAAKRMEELAISKAKIENRFLGFKGKEILKFHEILAEVLNGSKSLIPYEEIKRKNHLSQKDLWKFGISGDVPIILFQTNQLGDAFLLQKYIRAMIYFYHKHFLIDLVILNGESNSYEQYNQDKIYELLSKENANFLLHQKGGIHVLKEASLSIEDLNLLYAYSDMIIEKST